MNNYYEYDSEVYKERIELLKSYLKRLGDGEALESVSNDFVSQFKDVDASEIMKAEQSMLEEGTPLEEVQRLCDVHSALFHVATMEEREVEAKELVTVKGHPLYLLTKENDALKLLLNEIHEDIKAGKADKDSLEGLKGLAVHYAKKGDLLYPLLSVRYGISGPSDVMWTVDDEIRDEISWLVRADVTDKEWQKRLEAVIVRVDEMIYKEANILFPNCAVNFTEDEWNGIYHDMKDYGECFGVKMEPYEKAEDNRGQITSFVSGAEVVLAGGHMTIEQLTALLNTIPLEITFVDDRNINCYFNEGPKDFKRPKMAIGRSVFSCHPPKVEEKVRHIINEFRAGNLDEVPVWMEKNGKTMLVKYMAVRDGSGNYLGTVELVQNMDFAKEHFLGKNQKAGGEW